MDLGLTDRTCLVPGGTRGLGYAVAAALVAEGGNVVIASRSSRNVEEAVTALGERTVGGSPAGPADELDAGGASAATWSSPAGSRRSCSRTPRPT